jgi:signal transduction histidine kinase/ActR/RegA family two-component response regulator
MSKAPHHGLPSSLSSTDNDESPIAAMFKQFSPLIQQSKDLYFILDSVENRFVYVNDSIVDLLGFTCDEAQSLHPQAFMTAASMSTICDAIPRAIAAHGPENGSMVTVFPLHIQLLAKDRKRIPAELRLTVTLTNEHTVASIAGIVRDESVPKPVLENGGEFNRLLSDIFNVLPVGCLVCSPLEGTDDFRLQVCNKAAEKMTGIRAHDSIGRNLSEVLPEFTVNDVAGVMASVAGTGIAVSLPVVLQAGTAEGQCREYHICRVSGGFIVTLFHDLPDVQGKLEQAIGRVESNGVIAGKIVHDLNNVVGQLFGQVDVALISMQSDNPLAARLQTVMKTFEPMRELTGQLTVLSRNNPVIRKKSDIGQLLHAAAVRVLRGTSIEYSIAIENGPIEPEIDTDLLGYVFSELLENAKRATVEGGSITIEAAIGTSETVEGGSGSGNAYSIRVSDSGCGIPHELQGKLFKPVYGTGTPDKKTQTGLAIVKSIVTRHGGTVTLESEPEKGTVVTILLPIGTEKASLRSLPVSQVVRNGPGRVLVMDDEEILLDIATQMCKRLGLEVTIATESAEAVDKYREEFRKGNPYDLVMLDLTIPGGTGGLETAATLKKIDPEVKTVAMSGFTDHEVMNEPEKYGFTAILTKPFRLNDFGRTLRSILPEEMFQGRP